MIFVSLAVNISPKLLIFPEFPDLEMDLQDIPLF
jgi:hypothetical protein